MKKTSFIIESEIKGQKYERKKLYKPAKLSNQLKKKYLTEI